MIKKAANFALIPVRGGSKGIPKKNSRHFLHKPLVSWSIQQALSAKAIDRVFVSTDCAELAAISRNEGAEVPFIRPESYASDTASTESVIQHWLNWLSDYDEVPEYFTLLQATSPIRLEGSIDSAFLAFKESGTDSMVTVTELEGFTWQNCESPTPSYDPAARPRRQDVEPADRIFHETGSIYVTKSEVFHRTLTRLGGSISMHVMEPCEGYEIDTELDWIVAEAVAGLVF